MPRTIRSTERIVGALRQLGVAPVTLLVVPDSGWNKDALDALRALTTAGAELAGHGWRHHVDRIGSVRHRLHSWLISRNAAEHLVLDRTDIVALIERCHRWFHNHELPAPDLYVPPAWAMGPVPRSMLARLPFRQVETFSGIHDCSSDQFTRMAMVGYEADTVWRAFWCRLWNAINLRAAGNRRPLRVAIHPDDFNLRLAGDLERLLEAGGVALSYRDLVRPRPNAGRRGT